MFLKNSFQSVLLACAAIVLPLSLAMAAEPTRLVLRSGGSLPLTAVTLQGDKLVTIVAGEGYVLGQIFPLTGVDHVFGEKPPTYRPAIAMLLMGKPVEALKLLEPIVIEQRATAKIPGNFWLDAARAALVAYAVTGNTVKCSEIGKEISEATISQGIDPFVSLGKALLLPSSVKIEERAVALGDLTTDDLPADVCAYASLYRADLLNTIKRDSDTSKGRKQDLASLEAYLTIPCLFPSGSIILNSVAELKAAEFLVALERREEAVALLKSAVRGATGTSIAVDAQKRLETLQ